MRRILLCIGVVVTVASLGACGGGKKNATKATLTTSPPPSDTAPSTTAAPVGGPGTTAAAANAGASTGAATASKPGTASATGAGGAATTAATKPPVTTGNGAGNGSSAAGTPVRMTAVPAGHYHYTITSASGGAANGADLVVDPPQGSTQHSRLSAQSQQGSGTTDTTLDGQADGAHLVDLTTVTNSALGTFTLAFHPSPPPKVQPALANGATAGPFDMTSTDGSTIANVKVTVQAVDDTATIGDGSAAKAVRVQVDTVLRCAPGQNCKFTGTLSSTRWLRSDGLIVKEHDLTDATFKTGGSFGDIAVKSDTTSVVDKGSPA